MDEGGDLTVAGALAFVFPCRLGDVAMLSAKVSATIPGKLSIPEVRVKVRRCKLDPGLKAPGFKSST